MTVDLDEVRRLCKQASGEPWGWTDHGHLCAFGRKDPDTGRSLTTIGLVNHQGETPEQRAADAAFIAAARSLVPELVAEVERLRKANAEEARGHRRAVAAIQRVRDLADRMEREAPKPGVGGFLAEELRAALAETPRDATNGGDR